MMRYSTYIVSFFVLLLSVSCKNEDQSSSSVETPGLEAVTDTLSSPAANTPLLPSGPGQMVEPAQQMAPAPAAKQSANAQGPLNPPHGQPGHRCDIPDGAPLSTPLQSAPTPAPKQTAPAPQVIKAPEAQPVKTVTAPGMNPPHGEPGHRCDVAVGEPLPK